MISQKTLGLLPSNAHELPIGELRKLIPKLSNTRQTLLEERDQLMTAKRQADKDAKKLKTTESKELLTDARQALDRCDAQISATSAAQKGLYRLIDTATDGEGW